MSIGPKTQISLSEEAWEAVRKSRAVVDQIIAEGRTVYGINTGFGNFSEVVIPPEKLSLLQDNLIRSHASGVGPAMTAERTKRLLALRINVLAKGTLLRTPIFFSPVISCVWRILALGHPELSPLVRRIEFAAIRDLSSLLNALESTLWLVEFDPIPISLLLLPCPCKSLTISVSHFFSI